jgi:hypothetical protein
MTIDEIHNFINDLLDKEQGGYQSHEEIDTAIDRGSMWLYNVFENRYAISQEAQDALSPFKKQLPFTTAGDGSYSLPASENYQTLLGLGVVLMENSQPVPRRVKLLKEDELYDRLRSQLRKPTASEPVGITVNLGGWKLYPARVYAGYVNFLRRPAAPKYAYTKNGRVASYDAANSVQLEWAERFHNKIVLQALEFLGISLSADRLIEIGETLKNANA